MEENMEKTENTAPEPEVEKAVSEDKSPEQQLAEINEKYLRLYSDFDNFKKRTSREKLEFIKFAAEDLFTGLLPIADDFDRAIKANENATDAKIVADGVKLIQSKLHTFLKQRGIEEIKTENEVFNTDVHEAITNIPAPTEDMKGKIMECVEKGYFLNGKVIRYAKVVVGS